METSRTLKMKQKMERSRKEKVYARKIKTEKMRTSGKEKLVGRLEQNLVVIQGKERKMMVKSPKVHSKKEFNQELLKTVHNQIKKRNLRKMNQYCI